MNKFISFLISVFAYICILFSIISLGIVLNPWLYVQGNSAWKKIEKAVSGKTEQVDYLQPSFGSIMYELAQQREKREIQENKSKLPFSIRIPEIGIDSKVVSNVDASDPDIYGPALRSGVAHAYGSAFPGDGKMVYIFGHSTDYAWNIEAYNALFYEIKDLTAGSGVFLQLGEEVYKYKVRESKVVAPEDVSFLYDYSEEDVLILQTCYPPGTTWQRLIVVAEPVK
jgi:LPXTG-site transpeptidase (sortase) family protein